VLAFPNGKEGRTGMCYAGAPWDSLVTSRHRVGLLPTSPTALVGRPNDWGGRHAARSATDTVFGGREKTIGKKVASPVDFANLQDWDCKARDPAKPVGCWRRFVTVARHHTEQPAARP